MLDSQLQTIIQAALIAGFAARGVTCSVQQNNQPRQFAAPTGPGAYHTYGSRKNWGWPAYKDTWNETTQQFDKTRVQVVHTRFTIAGCSAQSPGSPNALSSADISQMASDILQDEDFIASLVAQQCNVFRVQDLPGVWFQDSSGQNVLWSSFDIIFTHKDVFVSSVGAITNFEGNVGRV